MAKKIGVLDVHQQSGARPQTYVRKSVAQLLVRRLLAEWVIENVLIQRKDVKQGRKVAVKSTPIRRPKCYEHHLEPKIEKLTIADSPWLRYLAGLNAPISE